jgi:hypothetical protein
MSELSQLAQLLAILLILLGFIGIVVPVLPSTPLIFVGCVLWAWADGFQRVGVVTLSVIAFVMILSLLNDIVLKNWAAKRVGATWKTLIGAILGGLIGGAMLSPILPVIGTIAGASIGAMFGIVLLEYLQKRDWGIATKTAWNYCLGSAISSGVGLVLSLIMIGIFAWRILSSD